MTRTIPYRIFSMGRNRDSLISEGSDSWDSVSLVKLIQYCSAIAVIGVKGARVYVSFQLLGNLIHVGTSLLFVV